MINEVVQLISSYLEHLEHGINEMAGTVPRRTLGGGPDDPAPPVVPVFNDVTTKSVAHDLVAPKLPAIVVWGDSSADVALTGYKIAKEIVVCLAFFSADSSDDLVMNRACGYILRGGLLTLARYNHQDKSKDYRELNGVRVMKLSSVTEERVTATVGRQKMHGFLAVRAIAVETYS